MGWVYSDTARVSTSAVKLITNQRGHNYRVAAAVMAVCMCALAACSPNGAKSSPSTSQGDKPSGPTASTDNSLPPSASPSSATGLMLESKDPSHVEIGFIDPVSGRYHQAVNFSNIQDASGGTLDLSQDIRLAPDLSRYAVARQITFGVMHAGWVDAGGNFTDINAGTDPGPFGGMPPSFLPIGFDGQGNFFYFYQGGATEPKVFEVPAGQTTGAKPTDKSFNYVNYITRDKSGNLQDLSVCRDATILNANEYLYSPDTTQIYRISSEDALNGGCGRRGGVPLLPTTNTTTMVVSRAANSEGNSVAFLSLDTLHQQNGLWTVGVGGGQPTQLQLTGINLQVLGPPGAGTSMKLIGWK